MNETQIAQIEARLERTIEGIFAYFFGRRIRARDMALHLTRAMEDGLKPSTDADARPFAPDHYAVHVSPDVQRQIESNYPNLAQTLRELLVDAAASAGYRLKRTPTVDVVPDGALGNAQLKVIARHVRIQDRTAVELRRVEAPSEPRPPNAHLIIDGRRIVPLEQAIISIGRGRDNTIVLDDPYVSRMHAQIRLRFGYYTLFDTDSQAGLFVNNVRIREHRLQPGDVIRMGATSILYLEDDAAGTQTDSFDPLDAD